MPEQTTLEKIRQRRVDKMRLGQQVGEIATFPSDPEVRVMLVPLLEREYINAVTGVAAFELGDNPHADIVRDEMQKVEMLVVAMREISNPTERIFHSAEEYLEVAEAGDTVFLMDVYSEMIYNQSPSVEGMSEEDFAEVKKALNRVQWSELSGQQWYAGMRFLRSIFPNLLRDSLSGSSAISPLTKTSDDEKSTSDA